MLHSFIHSIDPSSVAVRSQLKKHRIFGVLILKIAWLDDFHSLLSKPTFRPTHYSPSQLSDPVSSEEILPTQTIVDMKITDMKEDYDIYECNN